jgi:hypothetical protein
VWLKRKEKRGAAGAQTIYNEYITEFGEIDLRDPDLYEILQI